MKDYAGCESKRRLFAPLMAGCVSRDRLKHKVVTSVLKWLINNAFHVQRMTSEVCARVFRLPPSKATFGVRLENMENG